MQRSVSGVSIVSVPPEGGAIELVDLIITTDRNSRGAVEVSFADDISEETIFSGDTTLNGIIYSVTDLNWTGWADARLEVRNVNNTKVNCAVKYNIIESGSDFDVWRQFIKKQEIKNLWKRR